MQIPKLKINADLEIKITDSIAMHYIYFVALWNEKYETKIYIFTASHFGEDLSASTLLPIKSLLMIKISDT